MTLLLFARQDSSVILELKPLNVDDAVCCLADFKTHLAVCFDRGTATIITLSHLR